MIIFLFRIQSIRINSCQEHVDKKNITKQATMSRKEFSLYKIDSINDFLSEYL